MSVPLCPGCKLVETRMETIYSFNGPEGALAAPEAIERPAWCRPCLKKLAAESRAGLEEWEGTPSHPRKMKRKGSGR